MTGKLYLLVACIVLVPSLGSAQDSADVTFILDHNRIILPVTIYPLNAPPREVKAWFDNGNPTLSITSQMANELGLDIAPDSSGSLVIKSPGARIAIGGMSVPITGLSTERESTSTIAPGVDAVINLPSTLLRHYEIIVDYPRSQLTIGMPGVLHFEGTPVRSYVHPKNALIQVPVVLDSDRFNIALDMGTPVSLVSEKLISKWRKAHISWPFAVGAIGVANLWGLDSEPNWVLLHVRHFSFGGVDLPGMVAATCPPDWLDYFVKRVGIPTAGLMGAEALDRFRIGIDFANETVYFKQTSGSGRTHFDVVGLTLRPETNGRYTILGVSEFDGKPDVQGVMKGDTLLKVNNRRVTGLTMGGVWSLLSGRPGSVYSLLLRRGRKTIATKGKACRFLD